MKVRPLVQRASRDAAIELDLVRFRLRHGRTLASVARADGPVVLVVSLSDSVFQVKLEGVFAKALELRGRRPVFLVPAWSKRSRRYFRAFGFDRFVELSEYLRAGEEAHAREEAAVLLASAGNVEELKRLSYRGALVGVQALSTMSRLLHEGGVDFCDDDHRRLLLDILAQAIEAVLAAQRLLDDVRPATLLFNERNYAFNAPLSDLALERGVDVIQFVSAFQDDAQVFKRYTAETRRLHPRSLSAESWERVKALPWTEALDAELEEEFRLRYDNAWALSQRIQGWTRDRPAEELVARLGLDPSRKTCVVFSHVLWDANLFYGEDVFRDQEEWFVETVKAACANERVNWVVKLHPANVWKLRRDGFEGELDEIVAIREHVGELPAHVRLLPPDTDVSTRSLFTVTDVGVTIRGSIGVELPCFGIPVVTAGTGFYSGRGFTIDPATREDYLIRLGRIEETSPLPPDQVELARRHAYALFRLRPLRFTSFRPHFRALSDVGHPLDPNLELTVRSSDELVRADDLRRLGAWAVDSRELDYLAL